MMRLTDIERAYLAGLVDADGCIAVTKSKNHHQLRIHITQVNKEFLCYWQQIVGLGKVYSMSKGTRKHNKSYQWVMCSKEAERFLYWVVPFLVLKRRQADVALSFRKKIFPQGGLGYNRGIPRELFMQREECRQAVMRLNGRKVEAMSPTTAECPAAIEQ